jgi:hypothetical protein
LSVTRSARRSVNLASIHDEYEARDKGDSIVRSLLRIPVDIDLLNRVAVGDQPPHGGLGSFACTAPVCGELQQHRIAGTGDRQNESERMSCDHRFPPWIDVSRKSMSVPADQPPVDLAAALVE